MLDGIYKENYQVAKKMMDVAMLRHEALASNIANIQTPGFKRNEISTEFETQLVDKIKNSDIDGIKNLSPSIQKDLKTPSVRPDGNNVEVDHELVSMSKNSIEMDFLNNYVSDSIRRLKTAIMGKNM